MGTSATIKIEDRNMTLRMWVAHDGDRMRPCIDRAVLTGATVEEVYEALQSVITKDVYGGKLPSPACIRPLYDHEASLDAYADVRYRVRLLSDSQAEIISSQDLV